MLHRQHMLLNMIGKVANEFDLELDRQIKAVIVEKDGNYSLTIGVHDTGTSTEALHRFEAMKEHLRHNGFGGEEMPGSLNFNHGPVSLKALHGAVTQALQALPSQHQL